MAKVDVRCPFYQQTPPGKKHGLGCTGHQRYRCQDCCRCFQLDYKYRACQLGTKDKVIDLMMNNACIRDTARALHISINAVVRTLKNMLIYQIKLKNYCMNIHLNDKQLNCKISYELKLISSSLEPISIGGKFITLPSHIDV